MLSLWSAIALIHGSSKTGNISREFELLNTFNILLVDESINFTSGPKCGYVTVLWQSCVPRYYKVNEPHEHIFS